MLIDDTTELLAKLSAAFLRKEADDIAPDALPNLIKCLIILKKCCPLGPDIQNFIANKPQTVIAAIKPILWLPIDNGTPADVETRKMVDHCWKFVANMCVANDVSQSVIWQHLKDTLLTGLRTKHDWTDIARMIVYNISLGDQITVPEESLILLLLVKSLEDEIALKTPLSEYLQYYLEYFICTHRHAVRLYGTLQPEQRVLLLHFIADYVQRPTDKSTVSTLLFAHICKEFKKKSDCVLKTVGGYVNSLHPREVCALLEIIAIGSGTELYTACIRDDASLFLDAGCLLKMLHDQGKKSNNIFTPIAKLDQMVPKPGDKRTIETEISYELKSMLMRTVANMAYKNRRFQDLSREMEILATVLDCTQMDARNPCILCIMFSYIHVSTGIAGASIDFP